MPDGPIITQLRHPDGRTWSVTLEGLVATVVAAGGRSRARTFGSRSQAESFAREGIRQMVAAGYLAMDEPQVAAQRAAVERWAAAVGPADAEARGLLGSGAVRAKFAWLGKLGDEATLVGLADTPPVREVVVRALVAESQAVEAAWVAFVAGSPLLVPVLRWSRALRTLAAAERSAMPGALRTSWDAPAPTEPLDDTLSTLITATPLAARWAEWGPVPAPGTAETQWSAVAPLVVARARAAAGTAPGPLQGVFDQLRR